MAVIADMNREQARRLYQLAQDVGTSVILRKTQGSLLFEVFEFRSAMEIVWAVVYVTQYEPCIDPDGDLILDREIGPGDFKWDIPLAWFRKFFKAHKANRVEIFKVKVEAGEIRYVETF